MNELLSQPEVGIVVSIGAFVLAGWFRKRTGSILANPLLVSSILVILLITLTPLTLEQYQAGGGIVAMFILPATTVLALHIHRQWSLLGRNLLPVLAGCAAGCVTSIASVLILCRLLGVDRTLAASLAPKSVTTAIAIELAEQSGGIAAVAVSAVIFTGIAGVVMTPLFIRLLRLREPVELGVAVGTSAHAIGTSMAIGLGEVEGAMSGIALVLSGVMTSVVYLFLF